MITFRLLLLLTVLLTPWPVFAGQTLAGHSRPRAPVDGLVQTNAWAGYAVASGPYSSASATWRVPSAVYDGGTTPYGYEYVTDWVGIGGYGDPTLIQIGTESYVEVATGIRSTVPWYQLYTPINFSVAIPRTISPGDLVTASVMCVASCVPNAIQTWQLTMKDVTAGWTWQQSFQYASTMASAEAISEVPYYNGPLPLADYGEVTFSLLVDGSAPNLDFDANAISMSGEYGQTQNPSEPVAGGEFGVCWGRAPSFTPCVAGSVSPPPPPPTPVPSVSLLPNPTKVYPGASSTLTWSSSNVSSCSGAGFTAFEVSGSAVVTPLATTMYSISCSGVYGPVTATAAVTVTACHGHRCR